MRTIIVVAMILLLNGCGGGSGNPTVKENENIERALKRFKRKFEKTGVIKELRQRQAYKKPSIIKREEKLHAIYIEQLKREQEEA